MSEESFPETVGAATPTAVAWTFAATAAWAAESTWSLVVEAAEAVAVAGKVGRGLVGLVPSSFLVSHPRLLSINGPIHLYVMLWF